MTATSTVTTRQIILDTGTTGMSQVNAHYKDHKVIEIGAVEMVSRHPTSNNLHVYPKPDRLMNPEAFGVRGIADKFLLGKSTFAKITDKFVGYIHDTELVVHNAAFDIGFMDYELSLLKRDIPRINTFCKVTNSLAVARKVFPGKRDSFNALCARYEIDNNKQTLHEALLDAQVLAEIYLAMIGGQASMAFMMEGETQQQQGEATIQHIVRQVSKLCIVFTTDEELAAHEVRLDLVERKGGSCLWRA